MLIIFVSFNIEYKKMVEFQLFYGKFYKIGYK